jgi:hypothetical protein
MEHNHIASIGRISKKENLASVEHDTKTTALVLETLEPFPGYHGTTVPDRTDPRSMFLVTNTFYNEDKIIRAIQSVKKNYAFNFDGAPGLINLYNEPAGAIRIKYIHYQQVGEIASALQEEGINFMKARRVAAYSSLIKITKFFSVNKVSEGIYNDESWKEMYYLHVPVEMNWNAFEKITNSIKHNVEDNNFDAALMTMYDQYGVLDFIRIYDEQCCQGKLLYIYEKYLEAIRYLKD